MSKIYRKPAGTKGEKGETGEKGTTGEKGEKGTTGEKGATGSVNTWKFETALVGGVEPEGKVTLASNKMKEVSSFTNITLGMEIEGKGVPPGTTVTSKTAGEEAAKELTMSAEATATEAKQKYKFYLPSGKFRLNSATVKLASKIFLSKKNKAGTEVAEVLKAAGNGGTIKLFVLSEPEVKFAEFRINGEIKENAGKTFVEVPVTWITGEGPFTPEGTEVGIVTDEGFPTGGAEGNFLTRLGSSFLTAWSGTLKVLKISELLESEGAFTVKKKNVSLPAGIEETLETWAVGTEYAINALVKEGGIKYKSLKAANKGNKPSTSPTFWASEGPVPFLISTTTTEGACTYARLGPAEQNVTLEGITFVAETELKDGTLLVLQNTATGTIEEPIENFTINLKNRTKAEQVAKKGYFHFSEGKDIELKPQHKIVLIFNSGLKGWEDVATR